MSGRIRLTEGFRRLRRSRRFHDIHALIVAGVACNEIARKIQMEWREVNTVSQATLAKQLERYRKSLEVGGLAPHEIPEEARKARGGILGSALEKGGWAVYDAETSSSKVDEDPYKGRTKAEIEQASSGDLARMVEKEKAIPTDGAVDVKEGLSKLLDIQMARIAMEVKNEESIGKLMPGTGLEINVAKDILKSLHVVQGDLGLTHKEPDQLSVGIGIGPSKDLTEALSKSGLLKTISDKNSRKRILKVLQGETPLGGQTFLPEMSENAENEDDVVQVVENKGGNGDG